MAHQRYSYIGILIVVALGMCGIGLMTQYVNHHLQITQDQIEAIKDCNKRHLTATVYGTVVQCRT